MVFQARSEVFLGEKDTQEKEYHIIIKVMEWNLCVETLAIRKREAVILRVHTPPHAMAILKDPEKANPGIT